MKEPKFFIPMLIVVDIIRLYKLLHNVNHTSGYGVYNISTFITYTLAIIFMIIFTYSLRKVVFAIIILDCFLKNITYE